MPPLAVALADTPGKALWVAGLFLLVQQVANHLLVPLIMGRVVQLHPVSILFFVLALSALLAVPSAIIVKVLFDEFYARDHPADARRLDDQVTRILDGETKDNTEDESGTKEKTQQSA